MSVDLETLALAGTTLVALAAIRWLPPAYEKHQSRRTHQKVLKRVLAMHSFRAPLLPVPSLDRLLASERARSKAAASPTLPDSGLAAAAPKHRRAE